jgi:hypothetical protein
MKRTNLILILVMTWLLCSSRTCSEDRSNMSAVNEANAMAAAKDSIRTVFAADHPDGELLKAYEETAVQKLSDFADYLKIVSDTSLNIKFREQAANMIRRLFVRGETDVRTWTKAYSENDLPTLNEMLTKGLSRGFTLWIQPEQVILKVPLAVGDDSTYTGSLSFYPRCLPFDNRKPVSQISRMISIEILVIRKEKSFGDESLMVWEVYLGKIN